MKSLSKLTLVSILCSFLFSFVPENEETEEPLDDSCSCFTATGDSSSNYTLGDYLLDIEFDDSVCLGDKGIIKFNYPGIYLNQDSFPGCTNGTLGIDSFTNTITVKDNGVYQLEDTIFYSTSAPPDSIDIVEYLILHDPLFYSNVCDGTVNTLEVKYIWQTHASNASTALCEITDTMVFTCPSSYDLNASMFISQTGICNPATLFTSHSGNNTTQHTWNNGSPTYTPFSFLNSIVFSDPDLSNVQVTLVDSNFTTCQIGFDTLNTSVNYQGFEAIITSSSSTAFDCTDPTVYLLFPDLYLVDSISYTSHSFQWQERINGVYTNIPGETFARLKHVDKDGRYKLFVTNDSTPCYDLSNYIEVSGLRTEMYALGIDGGNIICLGDSSPELKFNPPLPNPFPLDAVVDVFYYGVTQNNDLSINNEGNYYVEIEYVGGCHTYSDTLIANLDTTICDSSFVISPNNFICINDPVAFIYRGTNDDLNAYEWTFAGGSPSTYIGYYPPLVNFLSGGSYTIKLEITGPFGTFNFEREIEVAEECCEHEYEATQNSDFSSDLGKRDKITEITGGGVFEGVFNVAGTIVLKEGVYTINDGSTFYVDSDCEDCDYLKLIDRDCSEFSFNYTQIIVGDGAILNMGDAEFRATCEQMWYGIGVVEGGGINTLNDVSGNNALVMDALAGITICDLEYRSEEVYHLNQITFTNNIIGLNDRDFAYPHHNNYLREGHIDNKSGSMKAPYNGRIGMAGINLVSLRLKGDFNKNYISNVNYGYYHWLIGDPNVEYHIKNNTFRDFQVAGVAMGGSVEISELTDSKFIFPKIHLGSASSPIPSYSNYDGSILEYDGGVFYYAYSVDSFDKNHIVGALVSGKIHFYGNDFMGHDSVSSPNYQVGAVIGRTFGIAPNDVAMMKNDFSNLGRGVDHLIGSAEIKKSNFLSNRKAYVIYDGDHFFNELLVFDNTFEENEVAIEIKDYDYELTIKENLFLDNDISIDIYHSGANALNMTLNCNKFQLDNIETYDRFGILVRSGADIDDIGGNNPGTFQFPAGNGWPVNASSSGYSNCITGTGGSINLTEWSEPTNWTSIEDSSSSNWDYYAYNNEFTGTFSPSSILNRQLGGSNNAPTCQVTNICFPLTKIGVALNDEKFVSDFKVYPNPARQNVKIAIDKELDKVLQIVLFDIGMNKNEVNFSISDEKISFNVGDYKSGVYVIFLLLNNGEYLTSKLIIE